MAGQTAYNNKRQKEGMKALTTVLARHRVQGVYHVIFVAIVWNLIPFRGASI